MRLVTAIEARSDMEVPGYEIHCGRTDVVGSAEPFLRVDGETVGITSPEGLVLGAYVHGLFLDDRFREVMLDRLGLPVAPGLSYQTSVDTALDELAAALEEHLDLEAMLG